MPRTIPGYQINPRMDDGNVIIRLARKTHYCSGGHDGQRRTRCNNKINPGDLYVEYTGESPLYESGYRYHPLCAKQQGLLAEAPKEN